MGNQTLPGDPYELEDFTAEITERSLREERDAALKKLAESERKIKTEARERARAEERKVLQDALDAMRTDLDSLRVEMDALTALRPDLTGLVALRSEVSGTRTKIQELILLSSKEQGLRTATAAKCGQAEIEVSRLAEAVKGLDARLDGVERSAAPRREAAGVDAPLARVSAPALAPVSQVPRQLREPATLLSVATLFLLLLLEVARRM